jgi:ubiquitin-protein ligase
MIHFSCQGCATEFHVPDIYAGRRGRCRICSTIVRAPVHQEHPMEELVGSATTAYATQSNSAAAIVDPPAVKTVDAPAGRGPKLAPTRPQQSQLPMRTRRLLSDAELIEQRLADFPHIRVRSMQGQPPDIYQIEYRVKGIVRGRGNKIEQRQSHLVEIQLTADYPRVAPKCKMNTPIFHPNIDPAHICVGDFWTAGERLIDLIIRIGEMITYQAYNIKSPLDPEAAMWADLNREQLPIDATDLHPADLDD